MIKNLSSKIMRTSKLTLGTKIGGKENFRMIKMPNERFEEYIDFIMMHFVRNEITHRIAGIPKCEDAMKEYRQILWKSLSESNVENFVCYLDSIEKNNQVLVGISSMKLLTLDNLEQPVGEIKTEPVKRFYKILNDWNNIFPLPELMATLGVERYFDGCAIATHPDYRGFGIGTEMISFRQKICKQHNVPFTGCWLTEIGSQMAATRAGWQTVFEISYAELGKRLNLHFKNIKHTCKYGICST